MQAVSEAFILAALARARKPVAKFEVKWDGTNWTDESAYMVSHEGAHRISSLGDDLVQAGQTSTATVVLNNKTKRFSRYILGGPLFTYIGGQAGLTGKAARLSVGFEVSGVPTYVRIFTGFIYNASEDSGERLVTVELRDAGWQFLQWRMSTDVYENKSASEWCTVLADALSIAGGDRVFDAAVINIPYLWLDDESPIEEFWNVAESACGRAFFDELGLIHYENPSHWATHAFVQALTQQDYGVPVLESNPDNLATKIVAEWSSRRRYATATVYQQKENRQIRPGETITFSAKFSQPCWDVLTPEPDDDYMVRSTGGQDLQDAIVVTLVDVNAQSCEVQIQNTHPNLIVDVGYFQIRGLPLEGSPSEQYEKAVDFPPLVYERIRSLRGNPYIQTLAQAKMCAHIIADRAKRLTGKWVLRDVNGLPYLQLGDRVRVTDPRSKTGTVDCFLTEISWRYGPGYTQNLTMVNREEMFPQQQYFIVGQSVLGAGLYVWY